MLPIHGGCRRMVRSSKHPVSSLIVIARLIMNSSPLTVARICPTSLTLAVGIGALASWANAASLPVANYSFELPATTFVDPRLDLWTKPAGQDQLSGVFANTAPGAANHITNLDGNQAAFLLAVPQAGFSQILDSQYEAGFQYSMTVGMLAGGNITTANSLSLELFYVDGGGSSVTVATTTVTYSPTDFPTVTQLQDRQVVSAPVNSGDALVGKNIGLRITANSGDGSGYWDLDNVRVTSTVVPEPGTWALLGLGLAGLVAAGHRKSSRP